MKLYLQIIKLLFCKFILRRSTGTVVKNFAEKMGIVYIKFAQILATQNYGNLFTEADRRALSSICDNCNPVSFSEIEQILESEYGKNYKKIFSHIDQTPVGSASVSQVHRAVLKNGQEVALKVKRRDVARTISADIKRIKSLIHRFGKFFNYQNFTGGDHALALYLDWIEQETDFVHERENIKTYQAFANNVNGKVPGTKLIKVPKLYEKYCTDNIIVMEFIKTKTVNQLELTESNKQKIITALNSYIRSSFWAMFNDQPIVFHGDPHSGNICIDDDCNICFLDMGLLCAMSDSDAKLCRKFFLTAYAGNYEKLYDMLVIYGDMTEEKKWAFREDCRKYCANIKTKEVTNYFIDMVTVCLNYEFDPPTFLFSMAKAFVCLNGICNFTNNKLSAKQLLQEQTMEFMLNRSINDCKNIVLDGLCLVPKALQNTFENGVVNTVAKVAVGSAFGSADPASAGSGPSAFASGSGPAGSLRADLKTSLDNFSEMLDLMKASC